MTGKPTDPRSMNRFLYAEGNPWTFIDPSGHAAFYEGEGCGAGAKYCGSTGNDQNAHTNALTVAKTGNPHDHDKHNDQTPQGAPQGTPCSSSICNPNHPTTTNETGTSDPGGAADTGHGTPPSPGDMLNAYRTCEIGAGQVSSMLMCMRGQLGSEYWAVVAFGKDYDGKFDGLPAWAYAVAIVAAVETGRVGYLGMIADGVGAEAAVSEPRIVIGAMEDLNAEGAILPGESTLIDQLPPQGSRSANWAQNARVLLGEMAKGHPIRDASVNPDGSLSLKDAGPEGDRFITLERNLLADKGWTYDETTTLWSPPR